MTEKPNIEEQLFNGIVEHPKRWSGDCHSDLGGSCDYEATEKLMEQGSAEIARLSAEIERMRICITRCQWALQPFSDRVLNDNGECTIDVGPITGQRFKDAHFAYKAARAALKESDQ